MIWIINVSRRLTLIKYYLVIINSDNYPIGIVNIYDLFENVIKKMCFPKAMFYLVKGCVLHSKR